MNNRILNLRHLFACQWVVDLFNVCGFYVHNNTISYKYYCIFVFEVLRIIHFFYREIVVIKDRFLSLVLKIRIKAMAIIQVL